MKIDFWWDFGRVFNIDNIWTKKITLNFSKYVYFDLKFVCEIKVNEKQRVKSKIVWLVSSLNLLPYKLYTMYETLQTKKKCVCVLSTFLFDFTFIRNSVNQNDEQIVCVFEIQSNGGETWMAFWYPFLNIKYSIDLMLLTT